MTYISLIFVQKNLDSQTNHKTKKYHSPPSRPLGQKRVFSLSNRGRMHVSFLFALYFVRFLFDSTMAGLDRTLRVLDALGLFIVTRFPFIELFMLLMSTGERADSLPGVQTLSFKDTLRKEYVLVYINAAIFFVCGTGMTLDFKRRKCGFAAALHAVIYTTMTLFQRKQYSEYLIVSKLINIPHDFSTSVP